MKLYIIQLQDTDDGAVAIGEVYTDEAKALKRYESLKDDVGVKVLHWGAEINLTAQLEQAASREAALERYCQHEPGCALGEKFDRHSAQIIAFSSCDCGLSDVLSSLSQAASEHDAREQAKGAAAEAARWRRKPGTYRVGGGGIEVIVDLPESLSYLQDEFPDEVAEIRRFAVEAERARLRAGVMVFMGERTVGWTKSDILGDVLYLLEPPTGDEVKS
jgi:hypothetical protein